MTRTFTDEPGKREGVKLFVGIMGPSGGGKTYSALRLATGIRDVVGGEIFVVDTEARRSLYYADQFAFRHVPFDPPFGPLDYLAAIEHCVQRGAGTIVIDSMSHEHEGPGGVLDMHDSEVARLSGGDAQKAERIKLKAWNKPKRQRQRLIGRIVQLGVHLVLCFRAKEKVKPANGEIKELGWMPVAGDEFLFEMPFRALLLPNANGVPTWNPEHQGEKLMVRLPDFARDWLQGQITEETGRRLAEWAMGATQPDVAEILARFEACTSPDYLAAIDEHVKPVFGRLPRGAQKRINTARKAAVERLGVQ